MPQWHQISFHLLRPEDKVEFFEHDENPNDDPSLTPRWDGPVEVMTASEDGGQTVKVGTEHFVIDKDEFQAWCRQGGYSWDEIQLRR